MGSCWVPVDKLMHTLTSCMMCCLAFLQFALSSLLLAVLLFINDGPDHLELQVETLDQDAFLR